MTLKAILDVFLFFFFTFFFAFVIVKVISFFKWLFCLSLIKTAFILSFLKEKPLKKAKIVLFLNLFQNLF